MNRRHFTFFLAFVAMSAGSHTAQAQTGILTLDECLEIALQNNSDLDIQRDMISEITAKSEQLKKTRLPQVAIDANYVRFSDVMEMDITSRLVGLPLQLPPTYLRFGDEDNYALRGAVSQPLFTGFRLKNNIASSTEQIHVEEFALEAEINSLVFRVKEAYYKLLYAIQAAKLIHLSLGSVDEHLKDVENLFNQGMVTQDEVLKAAIKRSEAELNVSRAGNNIMIRRQLLCDILGLPPGSEPDISEEIGVAAISVTNETAIVLAGEERPEIKQLKHQIEALHYHADAQHGDYFPTISIIGTYEYGKPGLNKFKNDWMDHWTVGITSNWKLWDWGIRRARVQEAKSALNRADHSLIRLKKAIALDVQQSTLRCEEISKQLELFRKKREQAEESFRLVQNKFKQGIATNTEFLDSEHEMTKSRIEEYNSIIDHNIALANYERAIGVYAKTLCK